MPTLSDATKTRDHLGLVATQPFHRRLREAQESGGLVLADGELPLGAIVATVVIDRCAPITARAAANLLANDPDEHALGLYEPKRYAWVLRDVQRLEVPVPFRGSQGIFEVPDELLGVTPAQGAFL